MDKSTQRTIEAIKAKEKIGIFGDYDVDGATSTALLGNYFSLLNQMISKEIINVHEYIGNKYSEKLISKVILNNVDNNLISSLTEKQKKLLDFLSRREHSFKELIFKLEDRVSSSQKLLLELEILREKIQQIQDELIQNLLGCVHIYELEEDVYQKMITLIIQYTKSAFRITKAIEAQEIIELVLVKGIKNKQ